MCGSEVSLSSRATVLSETDVDSEDDTSRELSNILLRTVCALHAVTLPYIHTVHTVNGVAANAYLCATQDSLYASRESREHVFSQSSV